MKLTNDELDESLGADGFDLHAGCTPVALMWRFCTLGAR